MACTLDRDNGPWPPRARRAGQRGAEWVVGEPDVYEQLPFLRPPATERPKDPRRAIRQMLPWLDPRWAERQERRRAEAALRQTRPIRAPRTADKCLEVPPEPTGPSVEAGWSATAREHPHGSHR